MSSIIEGTAGQAGLDNVVTVCCSLLGLTSTSKTNKLALYVIWVIFTATTLLLFIKKNCLAHSPRNPQLLLFFFYSM